jgi:hypothetical protein
MSNLDEQLKKEIAAFLRSKGLSLVEVPRGPTKTADFKVEPESSDATLIEVKQKSHDQKELEEFLEAAERNGYAKRRKPTGYRNTLAAVITSGVFQLIESDVTKSHFRVLWIDCGGHDGHHDRIQFRATLYGTQTLFSRDHSGMITCYYFHESSFYTHRNDLDGAIISHKDEAEFLLNNHSPRFERIKASKLTAVLGGAFFPQQHQLNDGGMLCDHLEPRNANEQTLKYLRSKYQLSHLDTLDLEMHEGVAPVRN